MLQRISGFRRFLLKLQFDGLCLQLYIMKPGGFDASTTVKFLHALRVFWGYHDYGMNMRRMLLTSALKAILADINKDLKSEASNTN